ncbi:Ribonuclease D [Streptomyces misionensis JCM 4497]
MTGDRRPRHRSRQHPAQQRRNASRRARIFCDGGADTPARTPRGHSARDRRRGRARRGGRRLRRRLGPRGRGRRARLRLPLRPARLSGAAAPRGRRHRADRPRRLPRPLRPRRGAVRRRVGAARRHPGPALPARDRHGADPAVRHRAGRPARRVPPGGPRRHGGERPRLRPGEGPLRRRLVHPPAPRALAALRRAGRGTPGGPARRPGEGAGPAGQAGVGPPGVRRHRERPARRAPQGTLAPHLRDAQGTAPQAAGRRAGAVGDAGPHRPAARRVAGQGAAGRRDRGGGAGPAGQCARPRRAERVRAPHRAPAAGAVAGRRGPGQGAAGGGTAAAGPAGDGPAAAQGVGRQGPLGRSPPVRRAGRRDLAGRAALHAPGEPDLPGHGPPPVLAAAGRGRRRHRLGRAVRPRRASVAGRAGDTRAGRGADEGRLIAAGAKDAPRRPGHAPAGARPGRRDHANLPTAVLTVV